MIFGPVICPKCSTEMTEGFLYTEGISANTYTVWVQGRPEVRVFTGTINTEDRDVRRIQTYRCAKCGFLESYAKGMR